MPLRREDEGFLAAGEDERTPPEGGGGRCPARAAQTHFLKRNGFDPKKFATAVWLYFYSPACKIRTGRSAVRRAGALCGGVKKVCTSCPNAGMVRWQECAASKAGKNPRPLGEQIMKEEQKWISDDMRPTRIF